MKTANSFVPLNPVMQFFVAYRSIILKDSNIFWPRLEWNSKLRLEVLLYVLRAGETWAWDMGKPFVKVRVIILEY